MPLPGNGASSASAAKRPAAASTNRGLRSRGAAGLAVVALAVALLVGAGTGSAAARATLGNAKIGTHLDATSPGYLDVSGPFSTQGGRITFLRVYVHGEAQPLSLRGVVYTDGGGHPRARVATTKPVSVPAGAAGAWVKLPFAKRIGLKRGRYWLGFWYGPGAGSGGGGIAFTPAKGSEWYARTPYSASASAPARFPAGRASSSSRYSVFAPLRVVRGSDRGQGRSSPQHGSHTKRTGKKHSGTPAKHSGTPAKHAGAPAKSGSGSGTSSGSTSGSGAQSGGGTSSAAGVYEDNREGFPKIAAYRPGCMSGADAARFDWIVVDGYCVSSIDGGYAANHALLGMIQPTNNSNDDIFAATYGQYDLTTSPISDPKLGTIRAFRSSDLLHNTNGSVHAFGSVNVLDWLSADTARWSADVMAHWARADGALSSAHPGIQGVWGDNDLWGDQTYAYAGTALDKSAVGASTAAANQATWDTNYVLHHDRLEADLPGMVIGGNDVSSYSSDPGSYRGSVANGWLLPGMSSAGMRECADKYYGLYNASGVDELITSAQAYLAGKAREGKQGYLMLNNCNASSDKINEYSLAVATIGGYYYWPYTQSGFWKSTVTIAPAIPDVTRNGARHWLGAPTAAPRKLASGLWKRTFQHGVVYVNMTGSTQTVDGHTIGNETGLFVSS